MMDATVGQFLTEQREASDRDRERHRERERRRDRRKRDRNRERSGSRERERSWDGRNRNNHDQVDVDAYGDKDYRMPPASDIDYRTQSFTGETKDTVDYEHGQSVRQYQGYDYNRRSGSEGSYSERGSSRYDDNYSPNGGTSRNRERDRNRGRDRDLDRDREDRAGDKWMTETPTNTVLLRGLPQNIDEKDIKAELMMFGAPIKEVRLMKRKDTGVSRGFAFVEFQNVTDAQNWMEQNQGQLTLLNQYTVSMYYSTPKTGGDTRNAHTQDWTCSKCGYHNFKRRDHCFKCSISKDESERAKEGDGFDQVGNNPCNTLLFRGLDALTIEENILAALTKVTALSVKNVKVIRDDLTGTSRGYGFVEMNSIQDSSNLLETLHNLQPFEVDGKAIVVSYAKNTFSTTMATMNQASVSSSYDYSQYQYDAHGGYYDEQGGYFDASGNYYAPGTFDYSAYYSTTSGGGSSTQTDSTNAAAAVAQAAIQQAQAQKHMQKQQVDVNKQLYTQVQQSTAVTTDLSQSSAWASQSYTHSSTAHTNTTDTTASPQVTSTEQNSQYSTYPVPDVSTYQYDEASGYYYDPQTTLYYDASTQYYYNSQTGQFLYWDGEQQSYLPAPIDSASADPYGLDQGRPYDNEKVKKEKEKKEKVKVAKKIAKDMAKWAKSMNAQKEAMKGIFRTPSDSAMRQERESLTADAGFAILEKNKVEITGLGKRKDDSKLMPPPSLGGQQPGLVASYGGDSDDSGGEDDGEGGSDESKLTDWTKMACLLCKRQFPSKEALVRHQQLSDLHKKNLEEFKKSRSHNQEGTSDGLQYRDRAKERREKFGAPEPPQPRRRGPPPDAPVPYEEPTKAGIGNDNIGSKLMKKMGWNSGMGLGKSNQGIVDPIQAERRQQQAGLGARGSNYSVSPSDSYKDAVKGTMYARYLEIE